MTTEPAIRRRLAALGAWLFFAGMLTGIWVGWSLVHRSGLAFPRLALAAHLNGLLGGLWLLAVAWSFDYLGYGRRGKVWLATLVALPAWANWLVTVLASALDVRGIDFGHGAANDAVALLLHLLVVLPALAGTAMWAWGFVRAPRPG